MLHFKRNYPEFIEGLDPESYEDNLTFQKPWRVGDIRDITHDTKKGIWKALINILPQHRGKPLPMFCSPTLRQDDLLEPDNAMSKWRGVNLTGLDEEPAFGAVALFEGTCYNTQGQCKKRFNDDFSIVKTDLELSRQKLAALLSSDNLNVQKVPVFGIDDKEKKKKIVL